MKIFGPILLAATAATGVMSAAVSRRATFADLNIQLDESLVGSPAYDRFMASEIKLLSGPLSTRNASSIPEYIYVLMCTEPGFRGDDCTSFGAPPGQCAAFIEFADRDSKLYKTYNKQISSLSSNTGGRCQFYMNETCGEDPLDRGLTASYVYDFSIEVPGDDRSTLYENAISSWRC